MKEPILMILVIFVI